MILTTQEIRMRIGFARLDGPRRGEPYVGVLILPTYVVGRRVEGLLDHDVG